VTTAKELADSLEEAAKRYQVRDIAAMSVMYAAAIEVRKLIPAYRPPQPSDDGKHCWLEQYHGDPDYGPMQLNFLNGKWEAWDVETEQYLDVTGNIWPCERPEVGK